jgi:hypothetical protein
MTLHIGRFDDFKGENTLLIEGDGAGIRELAALLLGLSDGSIDRIAVERRPGFTAHGNVTLVAEASHVDGGLREVRSGSFGGN